MKKFGLILNLVFVKWKHEIKTNFKMEGFTLPFLTSDKIKHSHYLVGKCCLK